MDENNTSLPGHGTDPLEPDFEKMLADEGVELEGRELPKPAPKPEDPPKPEVPPEAPIKETKPEEKPKEKEGKLDAPKIEPWRKAVADKHEAKQKAKDDELDRLRKENEDLKKPKTPNAPLKPEDQSKSEKVVLSDEQKALADKYGIEHDDYLQMFPTKIIEKEVVKSGLSQEQESLLATIQSDRESLAIKQGYDSDFSKNVLPLIKAEYPNISDSKIEEIKSTIFEKIQEEEYSMTPLSTLYKGEDEFRGAVTVPKKSLDEGSKFPGNSNSGKVYDFDNVTESDMKSADFPFEKYSNYMASKESGAKRN